MEGQAVNEGMLKTLATSQSEDKEAVQKVARKNRDVLSMQGSPLVDLKGFYNEGLGSDFERLYNVMNHQAQKDDFYMV